MFLRRNRCSRKYLFVATVLFCCGIYFTSSIVTLSLVQRTLFSDLGSRPFNCADSERVLDAVKSATRCNDNSAHYRFEQKGDYWVLYNYVTSLKRFKCEESVTYVTQGDYTFLNNLRPLLDKWRGPISIALYAPGTDFKPTLDSIAYLRSCMPLVKEFVTFHVYFSSAHRPEEIPSHRSVLSATFNCSLGAPFEKVDRANMYAAKRKLLYPINVGRNIARSMAETHFVLTADIELYPSPNLITQFLDMIAGCGGPILPYTPSVFVLHVFEIELGVEMPSNKSQLRELLEKGLAVPFHQNLCGHCHHIPKSDQWQMATGNTTLHIFNIGKRTGKYYHWEPFYIGTNGDPTYDERLSWEGMSDKLVQAYTMCVLDYSFLILDNAFLVHSPGIKQTNSIKKGWRKNLVEKSDRLIKKVIVREVNDKYGTRTGCRL